MAKYININMYKLNNALILMHRISPPLIINIIYLFIYFIKKNNNKIHNELIINKNNYLETRISILNVEIIFNFLIYKIYIPLLEISN